MIEFLAPNGKPSNLSPEQYELVRKPEFISWFGDWENNPSEASKIVDTNGEPLEVYHGTDAEFNVFDGGAYFTDDYMNADGYAGGENVFHIFLNIKKPLIFNANRRKWDNLNSKYGSSTREIASNLDEKKYDGVIFNNINDNFWDDKGSPQNVYYAINPEQIKLSDGSNETFDGNNPDIRFDEGGATQSKDLSKIYNFQNIYKGAEFYSYSDDSEKQEKADRWFELFIKNQKEHIITPEEFKEFISLSNELSLEDLGENNNDIRFDEGGKVDKFSIGKTYSGKQLRDIVSKYESQEGTDMRGFANENIILKDNYILGQIDIQKLIENDMDLESFISEEYNPNDNVEYDYIRQPILLGANEYSRKPNIVLDGYHRVLQALYNKDKKILAFINLDSADKIRYFDKGGKIDDKVGKEFWFEYHCFESDESCDSEIWYRSHQKVKVLSVSEWSLDELKDRIEDGQPRVYSVKFNDGFIADVLEDELMESKDEFYRPEPLKIMKKGGRTISQTPAPKKDQIKGSDKNKEGSAKDLTSAKKIKFADEMKDELGKVNEKTNTTFDGSNTDIRFNGGGKIPNVNHKDIQGKEFTYDGGKFLIVDFPNKSGAWNKGATWRKTAKHHSYIIKLDDIETNLDKSLFDKFNKPYYIYDDFWLQFNQKPCRSIQGSSSKLIDTLDYEIFKRENHPNNYAKGGNVDNELDNELAKIKEAYDYGSEYFDSKIYGQEYKIRMNKNHPRNSNRNDDQSIHNLSLVNVQYPSAVIFRENNNGKLQYQYDKILNWEDAQEKIEEFFYEINDRADEYAKGGNINWNLERYREVEKEMFELRKQGKGNTLEYFKLIKERSILEQDKMNPSTDIKKTKNKTKNMNIKITENFAKGGKILIKEINDNGNIKIVHQDFQKFLRIGITDKYFIEASNDVGLQGVNFDEASLLKKISIEFNNMLDEYEDYIINEDSEFITNIMKNKIKTEKRRGASLEVLRELELEIDNDNARKKEIREIAGTQKESLEQWILYLKQSDYNVIFKYLILKAVLKFNYTLNTDKLSERDNITIRNFTPFDAGSLAELYYGSSNYLLKDYVLLMNENSKKVFKTQEVIKTTSEGKWIKFNGGNKTTSKERDENGVQLMRLVQNTYWCTKSAGRSQLDGGDFYVYVTEKDGEILPRIAVRMNENLVGEIRGNFSSAQDIEPDMLPISESFLVENIPNDSGKKWLDAIRYNTKCAEMTERFNIEGMYQDFIFDYIKLIAEKSKYKVDYGENGNVVNLENKFKEVIKISNEFYKSGDIEIDSNLITKKTIYLIGNLTKYELDNLIKKQVNINELKNWKLKFISGDVECSDIITDLGNIEIIGKSLRLSPKFENLNKLKYIGDELEFNGSNVESLKNLESIGSGLMLNGKIKDLGKLKKIGFLNINTIDDSFSLGNLEEIVGDLNIFNDIIDFDFGNLKTIGGSFNASNSKITDLKNLQSVGNDFIISGSKIKNFQNLKTIGGDADFSNNFSSSTQNIESILGSIKLLNSRIMDFPKLNKIGGELYFKGSFFKSLGSIKYIGGNLNFAESKVDDLGDLESIGGYASFKSSSSNIKSLKKLKNIVKFANFTDSMVDDLGDLESIGGNVYFKDSKVKSLGKLNFVGGLVMMKKNNYNGLEGFSDVISQELKN